MGMLHAKSPCEHLADDHREDVLQLSAAGRQMHVRFYPGYVARLVADCRIALTVFA